MEDSGPRNIDWFKISKEKLLQSESKGYAENVCKSYILTEVAIKDYLDMDAPVSCRLILKSYK